MAPNHTQAIFENSINGLGEVSVSNDTLDVEFVVVPQWGRNYSREENVTLTTPSPNSYFEIGSTTATPLCLICLIGCLLLYVIVFKLLQRNGHQPIRKV